MDQKERDKKAAIWVEQLSKENPEVPLYMLQTMVDTYLLCPQETERIIYKHVESNKNVVN
jgi:hypothetical protein